MWETIAIIVFDIIAFFAAAAITYRWLFKRVFDFIISLLCIVATSPILLYMYVRARKAKNRGEIDEIFVLEPFVGKKGKTIFLRRFNGNESKWSYLARLFDLFLGRLSLIGYEPLTEAECETLTETQFDRHIARPGLIKPYKVEGKSKEEMLAFDENYAWNFSLFGDLKIFYKWLLKKIRGQN